MSGKCSVCKIPALIALCAILGTLVFFGGKYAILGPQLPEQVVVGPDSILSVTEKKALFDQHSKLVEYPENATEIYFHLEPANYATTDICGEYIRFTADDETIDSYVTHHIGVDTKTESPSEYIAWHLGVGDYEWWNPAGVEDPEYYENKESLITVDRENKVVYYSNVIRGNK